MKPILVAEDSTPNREYLCDLLAAHGYEAVEAQDGQAALEQIERHNPALILLDISMPVKDGYEVMAALKDSGRWPGLPVLAVSAYAMQTDRERALQAGFSAYITKPVDAAVLLATLQDLLRSTGATSDPSRSSATPAAGTMCPG